MTTHNMPSELAEAILGLARDQLMKSSRGHRAFAAIAKASDDLYSLDAENQHAVLTLVRGIFTHPGTANDILS